MKFFNCLVLLYPKSMLWPFAALSPAYGLVPPQSGLHQVLFFADLKENSSNYTSIFHTKWELRRHRYNSLRLHFAPVTIRYVTFHYYNSLIYFSLLYSYNSTQLKFATVILYFASVHFVSVYIIFVAKFYVIRPVVGGYISQFTVQCTTFKRW